MKFLRLSDSVVFSVSWCSVATFAVDLSAPLARFDVVELLRQFGVTVGGAALRVLRRVFERVVESSRLSGAPAAVKQQHEASTRDDDALLAQSAPSAAMRLLEQLDELTLEEILDRGEPLSTENAWEIGLLVDNIARASRRCEELTLWLSQQPELQLATLASSTSTTATESFPNATQQQQLWHACVDFASLFSSLYARLLALPFDEFASVFKQRYESDVKRCLASALDSFKMLLKLSAGVARRERNAAGVVVAADVFLSHACADQQYAKMLQNNLPNDITAFLDVDPDSGARFADGGAETLRRDILGCKVAVVILTPQYLGTKWPLFEWFLLEARSELLHHVRSVCYVSVVLQLVRDI